MKVKEMIEQLQKFDPEMPIVIRRGDGGGGYVDWKPHSPAENFPGGKVCLEAFERDDEDCAEVKRT